MAASDSPSGVTDGATHPHEDARAGAARPRETPALPARDAPGHVAPRRAASAHGTAGEVAAPDGPPPPPVVTPIAVPIPPRARSKLDYVWAVVAVLAVGFSFHVLYRELLDMARQEPGAAAMLRPGAVFHNLGVFASVIWGKVTALPASRVGLAVLGTLVAYAALAAYDRLALDHLWRRGISWLYVTLCSFVTYALAHNIGASAFTGAVVRYRAYTAKGLSAPEVAVLVAFCSFTFLYGTLVLAGLVLVGEPQVANRVVSWVTPEVLRGLGFLILLACAAYVGGSLLKLRPLMVRGFRLEYPRPEIALRQVVIAPLEICGAAAIIYFALPAEANPGYFVVLGVFLMSFSAALASHAPGGLGVLEAVFLLALPEVPKADVLAALVVFRLFYLLIPLAMSVPVILLFERMRAAGRIEPVPEAAPGVA